MTDWDDLRFFLAAARSRSLQAAAERLGCNRSTVARRIARLEAGLKATLFARTLEGLSLTSAGTALMGAAIEAEASMQAALDSAQPEAVSGAVRIGSSEGFGAAILAPALPQLLAARPGLRVELAALAGFLSASRREVDMAITLSPPVAHRVVVEPLAPYQLALYASSDYLARAGVPAEVEALRDHALVGYIDDLIYSPQLRYLDEIAAGLRPSLASASLLAQRQIIAHGGGVGVLPCFLAEGLTRVLADGVLIQRTFWLSINSDVGETARIRAVRRWLTTLVEAKAGVLAPHPTR
jgi:DNA-binding transcriptional LysR family regulator